MKHILITTTLVVTALAATTFKVGVQALEEVMKSAADAK